MTVRHMPTPSVPLSRRRLLEVAAAAFVIGAGGCSADRRNSDVLDTAPPTLPELARAAPSVALVGDSISYLSREALERKLREEGFGDIEFDALPGRRIAEGDSSGLVVLDYAIAAGLEPALWIVELGTNDLGNYAGPAAYGELIDLVLRRIPPPTPVVWVDTYSSFRLAEAQLFNATLRDAIARRGDAATADWYGKCVELGPTTLIPDGLHPTADGFEIFAEVTVAPIRVMA
jgi:lysophospholipase L1-like esterase